MDRTKYEQLCSQFNRLAHLGDADREIELERLRIDNPSMAADLTDMFRYDKAAADSDFLDYDSLLPTCSYGGDAPQPRLESITIPNRIDHYRDIELLGRGGMGVVLKAWDDRAERHVAIKMILPRLVDDQQSLQRFRMEMQTVARLEHRNIVPIFATGEHEGAPYFVMKYFGGASLKHASTEIRSAWRLATMVRDLSRAVAYAHDRGVIHRDLKPANVLINQDGTAFLADFGIAKRMDVDLALTKPEAFVGAPRYVAPEQLHDSQGVGSGVDVYGLGAILYECLAGEPPFTAKNFLELSDQIRHQAPVPPSEIRDVDKRLEAICLKCLAKSPSDRYRNANALADDLDRFLAGEPPLIAKQNTLEVLGKLFLKQELTLAEARSLNAIVWVLAITFVLHSLIFLIVGGSTWGWLKPPAGHVLLWSTVVAGLGALFAVNYWYHWRNYWRLSLQERQSGVVTLGVNFAAVALFLIYGPWTIETPLTAILEMYPPVALVAGVNAFAHGAMGSSRTLLIGAMFFPLALVFAVTPLLSPLIFALAAAAAIGGLYLEIAKSKASLSRSR